MTMSPFQLRSFPALISERPNHLKITFTIVEVNDNHPYGMPF
jgi:hypothetical protein